jgi:hypothetical protein
MSKVLTSEQLRLQSELVEAKSALEVLKGQYLRLQATCTHVYVQKNEAAVCLVCRDRNGWWCPQSAGGLCEYPEDPRDEGCVHCGVPEERL